MKSELRRVDSDYDADNPLLLVALGMVSALSTLQGFCDEHAPGGSTPAASASTSDDASHFVLGLIAFQQRLHDVLRSGAPGGSRAPAVTTSEAAPGSLLR